MIRAESTQQMAFVIARSLIFFSYQPLDRLPGQTVCSYI